MTTEFNSNYINHVPQVQNVSASQEAKQAAEVETAQVEALAQSTDVPKGQDAVAGQSQIRVDNLQSDMLTFKGNVGAVMLADQIFDKAYAELTMNNDPEAYEKACLLSAQFVNECIKK